MNKIPKETSEQSIVVQWIRAAGIGCFSVPNGFLAGGYNKWALIQKFKNEGMLPGAPDLICIQRARGGKPVAIEMKRQKNGTLSPEQKAIIRILRRDKWHVIVAKGAADAIQELKELYFS